MSPDEESLAARLDYILQQGVKEGLVAQATDWQTGVPRKPEKLDWRAKSRPT